MRRVIGILASVFIGTGIYLSIDFKDQYESEIHVDVEDICACLFDDPYAADNYRDYKKCKRKNGHAKADAPELHALMERAKRTPNDASSPEYPANYLIDELEKARDNKLVKKTGNQKSNDLTFTERGPANVAGRTRAVLILPDDPDIWVAGSASGGIWKSTDAGSSWTEKTKDLPNLGTNTLAMSQSNSQIMYAGTGEHFTRDIDGSGIYKSTDEGESWSQIVDADDYDALRTISRIAVHPQDPNIVYLTSRNSVFEDSLRGAIYRSENGGDSFELLRLSTDQRYDDIAVNPENFNTMYVAVNGQGVIKTTDGGRTWTEKSKGLTVTGRIEIATSPLDTNYVWGLAQGGASGSGSDLYLSKDGGENWSVAIEATDSPIHYLGGQGWYDNVIEPHPFEKNTVYLGGINVFKVRVSDSQMLDILYDIEDLGAFSFLDFINGTRIGGGILEGEVPAEEIVPIEIRFGQGTQKAHRFSVDGQGAGVPDGEYIYKDYVDIPFQAWDTKSNRQLMVSFRDQEDNGIWNLKTRTLNAADPSSDSREYIFVHNVTYADTLNEDIAENGGQTFEQLFFMWPVLRDGTVYDPEGTDPSAFRINTELTKVQAARSRAISDAYFDFDGVNSFSNRDFATNQGHHPDQHGINFIITDAATEQFRLVTTNDGGLYKTAPSTTPGERDGAFTYAGFGYNTTQFYSADKAPGEERYIGGMQDNSTWFTPPGRTADAGSRYLFAFGGDGFEALWNNRDPNRIIGSIQFNAFRRSIDGGETWTNATEGIDDSGPFRSVLSNNRTLPDRLFTLGTSGMWRSNNFGGSWEGIPIDDNRWSFNNSADVEVSPANADIILAGGALDEGSRLFVSTDAGETFNATGFYQEIEMGASSGIACHPKEENTIYALFSFARRPKVLESNDLGQTWRDISGFEEGNGVSSKGFPDIATNCLLVFPNNTNRIWVGTELGIVESMDAGASWELLDVNMPNAPINDLKIQDDQIIVATYGRGIWTIDFEGIGSANIFPPSITNVTIKPNDEIKIDLENLALFDSIAVVVGGEIIAVIDDKLPIGDAIINVINPGLLDGVFNFSLTGYKDGLSYSSIRFPVEIIRILKPVRSYFNNFTVDTLRSDFAGSGFEVRLEDGFSDPAIHSSHNYADNIDITYQLRRPIIVSEQQTLKYRDVVLVENGLTGARFGSEDFYDYVVVEGSVDGERWFALSDPYDSNFNLEWKDAFNAGSVGDENLFIEHEIDLRNKFNTDDIIFVRFRLVSDSGVNGWGWAIDDINLQFEGTTPVFDPAFEDLRIYPNPVADFLQLEIPVTNKDRSLRIINIQGQVVFNQAVNKNDRTIRLPMAEYASGIYFVEVYEDLKLVASEKIIKL